MKATKTVIGSLEKCYALGIFHYDGIDHIALYYDAEKQDYVYDTLDQGAGAANVLYYRAENRHLLFAANRETDEIAMYELNAKA